MSDCHNTEPRLRGSHSLKSTVCAAFTFLLMIALFAGTHLPVSAAEDLNGSISVTLKDGGKSTPCLTKAATVADFLDVMYLELGELDSITPALDERLSDGDVIRISRREYVEHRETGLKDFDTIYTHSPELLPGDEKIVTEGVPGQSEKLFSRLVVDGEIVEETLVSERILSEPVTQEVHMGFRSVPVSKLDFEANFDENGEPLQYASVLRSQRSAGYSAGSGAGTASGRKAAVGNVAVNPNVIPYGSKLFIQSSDSNFIYGYAIAADTGTALMQGTIAVDCFYDSYQSSANHGIKNVDIFILE